MSDNRKYYYLKLKENYFDDDSIVLLESITTFYRDGFKRKESATKFDNVSELPQFSKYAKTNTLKQRVERHTCELCGKDCRNLEIHQVKKLKDLKGNAEWVLLMRKRRRKTLVVCPECHKLIHS